MFQNLDEVLNYWMKHAKASPFDFVHASFILFLTPEFEAICLVYGRERIDDAVWLDVVRMDVIMLDVVSI